MALALYRKYRPKTFAELVGQNHIKVTLQNELMGGKIAHAYLFSGPRGLGKTTVARLIAKSINCLNRKDDQAEPCNECESCQEVAEGHSLDVIEIDAASHTGVDNVRENIIANARFTPTNRKFKIFIIDEVHMLSASAFNALLKTLEEPPAHAIFILATTEIHKIPQTIISRCQRFDFRKVSIADLVKRLSDIVVQEKRKVNKDVLERIARFAEGGVRDAESLLGQVLSLDEKTITAEQAELVIPASHFNLVFELINYLLKRQADQGLLLVNRLIQEGVDLQKFTADLIEVLRKLLLVKISAQLEDYTITLDDSLSKETASLVEKTPIQNLVLMIDIFIIVSQKLKSAEISQLPLELAVVEICQADNSSDPDFTPSGGNSPEEQKTVLTKPEKSAKNQKSEIIKSQSSNPVSKIKLTLEQIKEKWEEVLGSLKDYNQSLVSTLKHHQPTAIKPEGIIEISFKYKFYQQRVDESKNRQALEQALEKIFDFPLRVETVLVRRLPQSETEASENPKEEKPQSLDSLAQEFGGQIID